MSVSSGLRRPHCELPRPSAFPTIKGTCVGKSNLKTAVALESLTLDVYARHGQVLSLWKSATHDSLAHNNSLGISPGVKPGDWILLNRRTRERNVNTHLMGPITQMQFQIALLQEPSRGYLEVWFFSRVIYVLCMCSGSGSRPQYASHTHTHTHTHKRACKKQAGSMRQATPGSTTPAN